MFAALDCGLCYDALRLAATTGLAKFGTGLG